MGLAAAFPFLDPPLNHFLPDQARLGHSLIREKKPRPARGVDGGYDERS